MNSAKQHEHGNLGVKLKDLPPNFHHLGFASINCPTTNKCNLVLRSTKYRDIVRQFGAGRWTNCPSNNSNRSCYGMICVVNRKSLRKMTFFFSALTQPNIDVAGLLNVSLAFDGEQNGTFQLSTCS